MNINWKLKYGIIAFILGVVCVCIALPKAISFMGDAIKVDSVEKAKNLKDGDHVIVDITMSDGYYMTYTEDNKEVARYYVALFWDPVNYVDYALTVRVGKDYYSNMDEAMKAAENYFKALNEDLNTPMPTKVCLSIDGVIDEFSNEDEKKYAKQYVNQGYMDYIYVVPNGKSTTVIGLIFGGVFAVVGLVLVLFFFLGRKKDKERLEELRATNPGYYEAPQNVSFNNSAAPQGAAFNLNNAPQNVTFNNGAAQPQADALFNNAAQAPAESGNFNEVSTSSNPQQYIDAAGNSTQFNEVSNNNNQQ
ncbi:MAG: hypothetical protein K6G24_01765 [Lachnospiraceae bacterium]|nr:hypothetical protein [Lachnospiraceae bacterium]